MKDIIEKAWENRALLNDDKIKQTIRKIIDKLDKGEVRIAEKINSKWIVNEWIKKAVILYFPIQKMKTIEIGPLEFHDKIPLKNNYESKKIRVVPHAIARKGAYIS